MTLVPSGRLLAAALIAAALGGLVYGIDLTLADSNWRNRGGLIGMASACLLFFTYLLPISLFAAAVADRLAGLAPSRRSTLPLFVIVAATIEAASFWLVAALLGSGSFPLAELVPAAIAGAIAGAALYLINSSPRRSRHHG